MFSPEYLLYKIPKISFVKDLLKIFKSLLLQIPICFVTENSDFWKGYRVRLFLCRKFIKTYDIITYVFEWYKEFWNRSFYYVNSPGSFIEEEVDSLFYGRNPTYETEINLNNLNWNLKGDLKLRTRRDEPILKRMTWLHN